MANDLTIVPVKDIPMGLEVPLDDLFKIYPVCQKLEILCKKEKGIGISAVQAGIPWNLFLIKSETGFDYFVNCDYNPTTENKLVVLEGCLSIRKDGKLRYFNVSRYTSVLVKGKKLSLINKELVLEDFEKEFSDFKAVVMQHEIDHSKGILISDIGEEIDIYKVVRN